jgi:phosphatidate phosphatase PAH1
VIVVEQENGSWFAVNTTMMYSDDVILGDLACSPFHVRFGKFSLLRPYEKKVCSVSDLVLVSELLI